MKNRTGTARMQVATHALAVLATLLASIVVAFAQGSVEPSAPVAYREIDRRAAVEGVVEAERQSTLAAQVAGRVVARPVKAGDAVKSGQLLVQIDPRSAAQAEAASQSQVREAQANLANAKAKFERSKELAKQKFISQAALDQSEAAYKSAQARVSALLAGAGQAATERSFSMSFSAFSFAVAP